MRRFRSHSNRRRRRRAAFTLVEALVAITITVMSGTALLLGINSALQTTDYAMEQTIAEGMARQLLDEVVGNLYCAADGGDPYQTYLGPSAYEASGQGRERYDDIDDYNAVRSTPPVDMWGIALGTDDGGGSQRHPNFWTPAGMFDDWRQEIDVYYVDPSNLAAPLPWGTVSDYRMVEVRIVKVDPQRGTRELANVRQVVAYVPSM